MGNSGKLESADVKLNNAKGKQVRSGVLQVCSYYGGTDLYERLFSQLDEKGIRQALFYFTSRQDRIPELPSYATVSQAFNKWDRLIFPLKHRPVYRDLKRRIPITDFSVSHAHSLVSNGYLSWRMRAEFGIPYVVAVRSTDLFTFFRLKPHLIPLGRRILRDASSIVFLSPAYLEWTAKYVVRESDREDFNRKATVIPNGIDDEFLDKDYQSRDVGPIRVIQVSRDLSSPVKNAIATIRACDALVESGFEVELILVGELPGSSVAAEVGRREYIRPAGKLSKGPLRELLRTCTVFVMPSKVETFGLVYAEAMSQGLPVIYTRGQGFDGHFPDGEVGFAVEHEDVNAIAERILRAWRGGAELGRRALLHAQEFGWNRISDVYVSMYARISGGPLS